MSDRQDHLQATIEAFGAEPTDKTADEVLSAALAFEDADHANLVWAVAGIGIMLRTQELSAVAVLLRRPLFITFSHMARPVLLDAARQINDYLSEALSPVRED